VVDQDRRDTRSGDGPGACPVFGSGSAIVGGNDDQGDTVMPQLPPIGAEIPCSMLALDAEFEYEGDTFVADFRGGIKQRVDVNPADLTNSVRLRVVGFRMLGETHGLKVVLEQDDVDVEAHSILRVTQQSPLRFEQRDVLTFTAAFEKAEGDRVVLTTTKPMVMIGETTQYPPKADLFQLEAPVDLVMPDDPETAVGRITVFSYKNGGL
jgi:hypothetical protein